MTTTDRYDKTRRLLQDALHLMHWAINNANGSSMPMPVEVVFHGEHRRLVRRPGKGITRWEAWVHPEWLERVADRGLAAFPDQQIITLDAKEMPVLTPDGCDECFHLTAVGPIQVNPPHLGGTGYEVNGAYWAVTLGGLADAAQGSQLLAAARVMLRWRKALGVDR